MRSYFSHDLNPGSYEGYIVFICLLTWHGKVLAKVKGFMTLENTFLALFMPRERKTFMFTVFKLHFEEGFVGKSTDSHIC